MPRSPPAGRPSLLRIPRIISALDGVSRQPSSTATALQFTLVPSVSQSS
jgi:hypothetical protein